MTMVTRLSCCGLALMTGAAVPLLAIEARARSVGAALEPGSQAGAKASVGTGSTTQPTPSTPTGVAAATIPTEQVIVRARLDRLRSQIEPDLGATVYQLTRGAIDTIPQGDNAPLNQVLLQAPGVAQDSFGQIHVRGDHNEIQFRLDGVQLPEGLTVFGQALETRFAQSLSLITGALPAEYGFDTAAVIDIQTKTGVTDPGGEISIYGGARDYFQPSVSYGTSAGSFDLFVTGDFVHDRVGIENPTETFNAVHDLTNQTHGIVHLDDVLDPSSRISFIAGFSNEFYEIPNNPSQTPSLGLDANGVTDYNSADLDEHQREITDFDILSYQKSLGAVNVQTEVFNRYSSLYYTPDPIGDLLFNGVAQTASRSVFSSGEQTDASWTVDDQHTLRAGFQVIAERNVSSTVSSVLPALDDNTGGNLDGGGGASTVAPTAGVATGTSDQPFDVYQGMGKTGGLYGLYLQDEWHVLPKVVVNYGARFDVVDEYTHENQVSPRVNVVWTPLRTTTLHAGYARYFVPPPFELVGQSNVTVFNGTSAASEVTEDTTVKAERDNYFDGGVTQVILPGWQIGLGAYDKEAENLIDEGQFGAPIILTAFNYAHGEDHGYELNSTYDKGPWSLYGNVALSRAVGKDIDSAQFNFTASELAYISQHYIYLDHNQTWTGSGGIAYTAFGPTRHPARLSADLVVGSGLREDSATVPNGQALPGYYTINLAAVQTLRWAGRRRTQLRFDVINLLDRRYEIRSGTGVGVGAPQYGLRRTLLVGLAERF